MIRGLFNSSNKYRSRKEGKAIKINVIVGKIVQINSIICLSNKNRLVNLLNKRFIIKYLIKIVIIIKIIKVWSWKKIICSINGDALFWRFKFDHVAISKKRITFINGV